MSPDLSITKCRTCLSQDTKYQLTDRIEEENIILEMLDALVPQIHIKDERSQLSQVCEICVDKLLIGYKFQQLCITTHSQLQGLKYGLFPTETDLKLRQCWDPLMEDEQVSVLKIECDVNTDNEKIDSKSVNDFEIDDSDAEAEAVEVNNSEDSDTDSSNEKLSVLRERKLRISESMTIIKSESKKSTEDFICNECSKIFHCKSSLKNHRCFITNNNSNIPTQETNKTPKPRKKDLTEKNSVLVQKSGDTSEGAFRKNSDNEQQLEKENGLTRKSFECAQIGDLFNKNIEINERSIKNQGMFPCDLCDMAFDRAFRLKRHRSMHDKPHACEICNRRFFSAKYLKVHQIKHISQQLSTDDFPCPYCQKRFDNIAELKIHRKTHRKNYLKKSDVCEICKNSTFKTTKSLILHIKSEHPEAEKPFTCDRCTEAFYLNSQLTKHLKQVHKSNSNLLCNICEKDFKYKSALEKHMRSHNGERPFLCPQCGKTFRSSSNLSEHLTRHSGLPSFACPECPRRFKCGSDLRKHTSTHTNLKPHVCDICGFKFTRAYSLHEHKRLHSGDRPHKCEQCGKSFAIVYHLKRHMRTHTGEKPYKCKYCDRAYAVGGDLTKHLRIHLGEKTYLCTECPMAFKYNVELQKHLIEHYKMSKGKTKQDECNIEENEEQTEKNNCLPSSTA